MAMILVRKSLRENTENKKGRIFHSMKSCLKKFVR